MRAGEKAAAPVPFTAHGLHNTFRVTDHILSGSQPDGDTAFAELARLGVKTIVSVDGARPNVEAARKSGLRYIHLPLEYAGIPAERVAELTLAATTQPGAIYVHCHHGKHRGPAAVAVMCAATAGWSRESAEAWLLQAGTADDYPGLYRAVREFHPVSTAQLARVNALPEVAKTPAIVDAMIAMDERFDALKAALDAGWKAPRNQPDRAPAIDATILWEHIRELARTDDTARRSNEYRAKLADAEKAVDDLRLKLRDSPADLTALDASLKRAGQICTACHKVSRNERN